MCGIASVALWSKPTNDDIYSAMTAYLLTSILKSTEERGRDATGLLIHSEDTSMRGIKVPLAASKTIFMSAEESTKDIQHSDSCYDHPENENRQIVVGRDRYVNFIKEYWLNQQSPIRSVLGHCRKSTSGTPKDNNNNHPVFCLPIVGIHNGKAENADKIFEVHKDNFNKDTEVDSEAIFKLMQFMHPDGEPGDASYIKDVAERVEIGNFTKDGTAILAVHKEYPGLIYGFRKGHRPLELAFSKKLGAVFIMSELKFLRTVVEHIVMANICGWHIPFPDFKTTTIGHNNGIIIDTNTDLADVNDFKDFVEEFSISSTTKKEYKVEKTTKVEAYGAGTWYEGDWHSRHTRNAYGSHTSSIVTNPVVQKFMDTQETNKATEELDKRLEEMKKENTKYEHDHTGAFTIINPDPPTHEEVNDAMCQRLTKEKSLKNTANELAATCSVSYPEKKLNGTNVSGDSDHLKRTSEEIEVCNILGVPFFHKQHQALLQAGVSPEYATLWKKILAETALETYKKIIAAPYQVNDFVKWILFHEWGDRDKAENMLRVVESAYEGQFDEDIFAEELGYKDAAELYNSLPKKESKVEETVGECPYSV